MCCIRFAAIDHIRPRLAAGRFQRLGNDESEGLRKHKAQKATVKLPQPIFPPIWTCKPFLPRYGVYLVVRKQSVDEESVNEDDGEGGHARDTERHPHRDALMDGIRILEGFVLEGERLMIRFDGVDDVESDDAGTVWQLVLAGAILGDFDRGSVTNMRIT